MKMEDIKSEIKKILNDTLSAEVVTYYPTKADKKRNPDMKPSGGLEVIGINKATNRIMKLFEKYKGVD